MLPATSLPIYSGFLLFFEEYLVATTSVVVNSVWLLCLFVRVPVSACSMHLVVSRCGFC